MNIKHQEPNTNKYETKDIQAYLFLHQLLEGRLLITLLPESENTGREW